MLRTSTERLESDRGGAAPLDGRARPRRRQGRDRRDPAGRRWRRGGALGRRPRAHARALRRAARLPLGAARGEPERRRRLKEGVYAIKGDGAYSVYKYEGGTHRVQRVPDTESQGRIHTSTATIAVMPEAEDARRRGRREGPEDRRLPLLGPGRPVGQHDRLGGADHPPADRDRRRDAGRELAAAEPRQGDARAARPPLRARARDAAGGAGRAAGAGRHGRARREDPHLQLPAAPCHGPPGRAAAARRTGSSTASSPSSPTRCTTTRSAGVSRTAPSS